MFLYGLFFKNPNKLLKKLVYQVYQAYSCVSGGSGAPCVLATGIGRAQAANDRGKRIAN
ncbi:hypothetical protein [Mucilaginibacter gotjawali]|uniref:Uncharacterized protein n=1 Tax=Mucilaginibacter gotjawali TaxID=1550579 RepID=A0A839SDR7_9SPHI|nr:hypothetical protein [Mucilaginibacter gotjawali]MBB3054697.1 hypothetical protein [Mucilaginibacter gotjawali]